MAVIESFLVTALPFSADPAQHRHISLFITHRLTPNDAQGEVGDFPNIARWTDLLAGSTVTVTGHTSGGAARAIAVTPQWAQLDTTLWPRVFSEDLPVLPWNTPDPASKQWRTFPAHRMQAHALTAHALSTYSSPVTPPSTSQSLLAAPLLQALFHVRDSSVAHLLESQPELDARVTKLLDSGTAHGPFVADVDASLRYLMLLAGDAHLAHRYYDRPEEQGEYHAKPTGASTPPVVQPPPDFHRRASLIGDLSPLLRKLGLVIDLEVIDVSQLAGLADITAQVTVPGLANPITTQPRVSCQLAGGTFTAVSTGDYHQAMLRLGDEDLYTLLDLDPDASGLKLEQYVRNIPRMAAVEANGDPGNAAPSTLRATGFAIARNDRATPVKEQLTDAPKKDADLASGKAAPLYLEDVARGVRLEVWDDVSKIWHSLHRRLLTVDIDGAGGPVLSEAPDCGFLQGAALTRSGDDPNAPLNLHEVLAGWDGWSLSAPRPGKVVVHDDDPGHDREHEKLVDPPVPVPDPDHPVANTVKVEPGTLPRLRYGRNYSFRAWAVDLAGNSSPHTVAGPADAGTSGVSGTGPPAGAGNAPARASAPDGPLASHAAEAAATERLSALGPTTLGAGATAKTLSEDLRQLRGAVLQARPLPEGLQLDASDAPRSVAEVATITGHEELDRVIKARRTARVPAPAAAARQALVEQAMTTQLHAAPELVRRTDTQVASATFAQALTTSAASLPELQQVGLGGVYVGLLDGVTAPRPFLRWDPVLEPTVVPRFAYTDAESLLTLVIRSGVEGPGPDGITMTVVPPDQYVASVQAATPDYATNWRADSQRHLVPPKATQYECELHGLFDAAMGAGDPASIKAALAVALRESGTLTDTTIADLAEPGVRNPVVGIELVTGPTADDPLHTDPAQIPRGDGLSRGQYAIHTEEDLALPYLPDPLADGVSFMFPDAGKGTVLSGLLAMEGTHLPYGGAWPERIPWRMVLASSDTLRAEADGAVVTFGLPAGQQLRMRLSSSLLEKSLDLLGLWRSMPANVASDPMLTEAAVDGWLWALTPATSLRLVHAVPRPLLAPHFTLLRPTRTAGSTTVTLVAGVDVHGASTDRLDIEAKWTEIVDDVTKPAVERVDANAQACHTTVAADEDLAVLADADFDLPLPDGTVVHVHAAQHHLGDTKHRMIDYRARGTTRFAEYFDPHLFPTTDDKSVAGPWRRVNVPSSARPPKPVVHDVLPLLRWHEETEQNQPFALSRTRACGVRIYLERPWFASGNGELLGVLLRSGPDALTGNEVSQWGADPVFRQQGPVERGELPLTDFLQASGLDDSDEDARPVRRPAIEHLVDLPGTPEAYVLGYRPEWSAERNMWFVDIAVDPGTAFWPFLRLSVARYQPSSLPGLALSPVAKCDFVQLLPPRTALLSRPDADTARIIVTGPVGIPHLPNSRDDGLVSLFESRVMIARLEKRVRAVPTDLGWTTVHTQVLPVRGMSGATVSWAGELTLPKPIAPVRPGANSQWRVVVEEWEGLPADPVPYEGAVVADGLRLGRRIMYADQLHL